MSHTASLILYVSNPIASARFYAAAFGLETQYATPGFAMLRSPNGLDLGLWKADAVIPATTAGPGAAELALAVPDKAALKTSRDTLGASGATIVQEIETMDFGSAFTVTDPDGHRIRLFVPREAT